MIYKILFLFFIATSIIHSYTVKELNNPTSAVFDITKDPVFATNSIPKIMLEVEKIKVEIDKVTVNFPREVMEYSCGTDEYSNVYCPEALAPADTYWDYEDGFSIAVAGGGTDYVDKTVTTVPSIGGGGLSGSWKTDRPWWWTNTWFGYDYLTTFTPKHPMTHYVHASTDDGRDYHEYGIYTNVYGEAVFFILDDWGTPMITQYINDISNPSAGGKIFYSAFSLVNNTFNLHRISISTLTAGRKVVNFYNANVYYDFVEIDSQGYIEFGRVNKYFGYVEATTGKFKFSGEYCESGVAPIDGTCTSLSCPSGYSETTGTDTANGECKKTISYTYYNYLCSNETNAQNIGFVPTDVGGDKGSDATYSEAPPSNNCKRQGFTCNSDVREPAWVDDEWQCSPYNCDSNKKCATARCVNGSPQPDGIGYDISPLNATNSSLICNSPICDAALYQKLGQCGMQSKCPTAFGVYEENGNCYKDECPKGATKKTISSDESSCLIPQCPEGYDENPNGGCDAE